MRRWLIRLCLLCLLLLAFHPVKAENNDAKQTLNKIDEIEEWEEKESQAAFEIFNTTVWLNGLIEFNFEYLNLSEVGEKDSGSSSDFYIGTVELSARALLNEWTGARIVVNSEDIRKEDGNKKIRLEDATIMSAFPCGPVYFIGGKTVMPFGVFRDHLIEGTLAEDLYEIHEWGATIGFKPDFHGLDISFSVYEDPEVANNLKDFDVHEFREDRLKDEKFRSYIVKLSVAPFDDKIMLSACFDSEPGDQRRNQSIGGALAFEFWKFSFDMEYIAALTRENGEDGKENRENAWVGGLAFEPMDSFELAARCEFFDDDRPGDQDETLRNRLVGGFNYGFSDDSIFSVEYRVSKYEKEKDSDAGSSVKMVAFQLAIEF